MHVARVALVPDRRYSDLGFAQILVGEPHAVEDGLGPALGLGFGDAGAVLVELEGRRRGLDGDGRRRRLDGVGDGGADGGEGETWVGAIAGNRRLKGDAWGWDCEGGLHGGAWEWGVEVFGGF